MMIEKIQDFKNVLIVSFLAMLLMVVCSQSQQIVINELMPNNVTFLQDEDGDYPDWIELYNGGATVHLNQYGISDDSSDPFKWVFPDIAISPGAHFLLFASGKNKSNIVIHLETVIDWGDVWHYFVGDSMAPPPNWNAPGFADTTWLSGPSGFGCEDGDDSTWIGPPTPFDPPPISIFIRRKFTVADVNSIVGLLLHVDYDDGFVAYLNGAEIARANIGTPGVPPAFNQFANSDHEAWLYRDSIPDKFRIQNYQTFLHSGENVLAVELHNSQLYSTDLTLIPFLTFEMNTVPPNARGPSPVLQLSLPNFHTNFRINAGGENLLLTDPQGNLVDSVNTGFLPPDISSGRQPDGSNNWLLFTDPTPGESNTTPGYTEFSQAPQISQAAGFYGSPLSVELTSPAAGAAIYYTLDGSTPTDSAEIYAGAIQIDSTRILRARAFEPGRLPSRAITASYFINENFSIPVISLSTDPANFFDWETGLYVMGPGAGTDYPYFGANFWKEWEKPIHVEFFEPNGQMGFSIDAGTQVFGSWSRLYPQKSLSIYARDQYGDPEIPCQIFPEKPITSFQAIVLRNSGQDWGKTFFRDAMMQSRMSHTDLDIQAYRPAMVFINGQIWGIHNVREKMNEHYLASNRGVDPDNIDFVERDTIIIKGDGLHYAAMLNYVETHDMVLPANYDYIRTQMDVDNFMTYMAACLFFANPDWPWNNVRCWRPRTASGRWKWMLYDLDYGFHAGHLGPDANTFNELQNQQTGVTALFFKLAENSAFRNAFINRYADHLNTTFDSTRVLQVIGQFKTGIEPEMPHHIARWQYSFQGPWWLGKSIDTMQEWYDHIEVARDFARQRPDFVRQHIVEQFQLFDGSIGTLHVNASPANAGRIRLNSLLLDAFPWAGKYFPDIPVKLTAIPNPGYRFGGWTGVSAGSAASITVHFTNNQQIAAIFEPDTATTSPVVINEINYKSAPQHDTEDWVEFYNSTGAALDISGWQFKDSDDNHSYTFSAGTILPADGYLVLCRDAAAFKQHFPVAQNYVGEMGFGLSSDGELLRLFNDQGILVDSLTFGVTAPWPAAPNGNGPSLALKDPFLENALPENWGASAGFGTPGAINTILSGIGTAANANLPVKFELLQNFPNPFNPSTSIRFSLPNSGRATLIIYDLAGRKVKTLIDKQFAAGSYSINWNGTDETGCRVASGIFFYRLQAENHSQSRKLILIK